MLKMNMILSIRLITSYECTHVNHRELRVYTYQQACVVITKDKFAFKTKPMSVVHIPCSIPV